MIKNYSTSLLIILFITLFSCEKKSQPIVITTDNFHNTVNKVVDIMVHDIFSPPVASRVFAYPNIAAYEIIAQGNPDFEPLKGKIKHLKSIPKIDSTTNVNYQLAALVAHMEVSKRLIFSRNQLETYRDSLYQIWEAENKIEFQNSKTYGLEVANFVYDWMRKDNYDQTRTMPAFSVNSNTIERWVPTPPAYMDGLEPHWNKIRPFVLDSAEQFKPIPPPKFSMEKSSDFYKELKEVYDISLEINKAGDTSEKILIAQFWDCNPYVSVTKGHLMFALKKITPGAHWIGITKIACKSEGADLDRTIFAYTKTSIAIADAFISCWDEKYRSNLVRPETLINNFIDDAWEPILQTPPFPEYTSGHSVISGAAATVLTDIFGDNFKFLDDTETRYGLPIRSFNSFNEAAQEAAMSRMYGGIHYRSAVEVGVGQGIQVGKQVLNKLK